MTGHPPRGGAPAPGRPAPPPRAADREAAARTWKAMSALVLRGEDRRKEISETLGLSFFRAKALRRLLDGPLTMRELALRLATEKPYTTLLVDDLEERGYVRREPNPADRRSRIVSLTPAGAAAARKADEILARPPQALLGLAPERLALLEEILAELPTSEL